MVCPAGVFDVIGTIKIYLTQTEAEVNFILHITSLTPDSFILQLTHLITHQQSTHLRLIYSAINSWILTSWLSIVVSNCELVTFPLVAWVSCGT